MAITMIIPITGQVMVAVAWFQRLVDQQCRKHGM
jgi:hypothetical protein